MLAANVFTPIIQAGHEIRIECAMVIGATRIGREARHVGTQLPLLPDQRIEETGTIELRKAENVLQAVRHGAVRR